MQPRVPICFGVNASPNRLGMVCARRASVAILSCPGFKLAKISCFSAAWLGSRSKLVGCGCLCACGRWWRESRCFLLGLKRGGLKRAAGLERGKLSPRSRLMVPIAAPVIMHLHNSQSYPDCRYRRGELGGSAAHSQGTRVCQGAGVIAGPTMMLAQCAMHMARTSNRIAIRCSRCHRYQPLTHVDAESLLQPVRWHLCFAS